MAGFNGHKSWNHWNVSLWINNDEGLYRMALAALKGRSKEAAALTLLRQLPEKTPDGAPYTISAVRAALRGM